MPVKLMVACGLFSLFLFYQKWHVKNFRGAWVGFCNLLSVSAFVWMVFGTGFLLYWGYKFSWMQALILFGIGFGTQMVWFIIEALLKIRDKFWIFSVGGLVALPILAYMMWSSLP